MNLDYRKEFEDQGCKDDVNKQYNSFLQKYNEAIDLCVPKKTIQGNERPNIKTTPLDRKILKRIRKKHRAWQRFMETRRGEEHLKYCRERNQVKSLIRKTQKNII